MRVTARAAAAVAEPERSATGAAAMPAARDEWRNRRDAPAGPSRRRAARVAQGVALAALFVVVLEATCRVEDRIRYGTPFFARTTSHSDLAVRDADGVHGRPHARYQKWVMNGLGMRGPEVPARKPASTLRVVVAGASETFGLYESPGREYPRQLEDSLRASIGRGAAACPAVARVEVLNAALPGMSLPTIEQDLTRRVGRLAPDIVVVYPTPAFFVDRRPPTAAAPDSSGTRRELPLARAFQLRSVKRVRDQVKLLLPDRIATWLRRREIDAAVRAYPPGWRYTSVPADRLELFEQSVRRVVGAVRAIGARPVLATHGNAFMGRARRDASALTTWERFTPRATGEALVAFDSAAREATLRVARDSGAAVADVAASLAGGPRELFADFVHFTDAGAARVAGSMARAVGADARRAAACAGPANSSER